MAIPASRFASAMVMTWNLDIFLDVSLQNGTVAGNLLFTCLFVLCVCVCVCGVGDTVVLGFCRLLIYREDFFFFFLNLLLLGMVLVYWVCWENYM